MTSGKYCTVTAISVMPCFFSSAIVYSMTGRSRSGTIGFGVLLLELVCPLAHLSDVVTEALPTGSLADALQASGVSLHVKIDTLSEAS